MKHAFIIVGIICTGGMLLIPLAFSYFLGDALEDMIELIAKDQRS